MDNSTGSSRWNGVSDVLLALVFVGFAILCVLNLLDSDWFGALGTGLFALAPVAAALGERRRRRRTEAANVGR